MPIYQLHHEYRDGHTNICSQREVNTDKEIMQFLEDTKKSHPLPDDTIRWLFVSEQDPRFIVINDERI